MYIVISRAAWESIINMKIGIDARTLYSTAQKGIGVYLYNLLMNISDIDKQNSYILYYDSKQEIVKRLPRLDNFTEKGIEIGRGEKFHLWEQMKLPAEVRRDKIDLFHSPANTTMGFMVCPTIVTVHDTIAQEVEKSNVWDRFYFNNIQPAILRGAGKIVTPSAYSKDRITDMMSIRDPRIEVIANGIDRSFRKMEDSAAIEMTKIKYKITKNYILNVGGESAWKNVSLLIKAYAKLVNEDNVREQLVITGIRKEAILSKHLNEVSSLGLEGKVMILGYVSVEDLICLYSGASVFVYPSLNEGFGFPPLEAMACGTPVVASNSASIPEVVGNAALMVDARSAENIADGIKIVISDSKLRDRLIAAGFERCKKFDWKKTAEKTLELYEKIFRYN